MKKLILVLIIFFLAGFAHAKIYKWVDENGTVHFSDKPYSGDAKEITVKSTEITLHQDASDQTPPPGSNGKKKTPVKNKKTKKEEEKEKVITEDDYRINANVGKLGSDAISISGRISSGPRCDNLTITATASSDTGLSGSITTQTRKATSHGSATFKGATRVTGSAEDLGFWEVTKVTVRCNDSK